MGANRARLATRLANQTHPKVARTTISVSSQVSVFVLELEHVSP
jgi:hypothetical protein